MPPVDSGAHSGSSGTLSRRQAAGPGTRGGLRGLARVGGCHHLPRYRESRVDRELASGRRGNRCTDGCPGPGRSVPVDVLFRFIPAVNGVLLGSLLYQSRLVPRWLPVLGFIGAALLVASWFAILAGRISAISRPAAVAAVPIAIWEFSLGVYLTFRGFKPSPITAGW